LITVHDLEVRAGARLLMDGVTFQITAGDKVGLVGRNGAGKTTLTRILAGEVAPTSGDATIGGFSVTGQPLQVKNVIGVVPQEIALYDDLTALENLMFWGRMYGMGGAALKQRVAEVLEQVGLADRAKERVKTYSGGMKRRINIGVGLLHRPRLLFMDEPTVGIDPQSRNAILESVESLSTEGMAVLYTTHYMEEAEKLCDEVAIVDQGKVIACGSPRELIASLAGEHVIEFSIDGQTDHRTTVDAFLADLPAVRNVRRERDRVSLEATEPHRAVPALLDRLTQHRATLSSLTTRHASLEDVFVKLTGRHLEDKETSSP